MRTMLVACAVMALSAMASAKGDPEIGKTKVAVCSSCHGANGIATITSYPNLAGQNYDYLVATIKAYKAKSRTGLQAATMYAMAATLSDEDIEHVAAFYASLPGK